MVEHTLQALLRLGRVRTAMLCVLAMLSSVIAVQTGKFGRPQANGVCGRLNSRDSVSPFKKARACGYGPRVGGRWGMARVAPAGVPKFLGPRGGPVRPSRIAASRCCLAGGAARFRCGAPARKLSLRTLSTALPCYTLRTLGGSLSTPWHQLPSASLRPRPPRAHAPRSAPTASPLDPRRAPF